jgi:sulfur relay (sulfurtransferase) DsrC/TusE family protein
VGEQSSDIRMMQRSQRSSTKDSKNASKHNNIILWADGWEKCVGALELLREADPEFHKRVRIADGNYDTSGQKRRMERVETEVREFTTWSAMKAMTTREKHMMIIEQLREFYETHGEGPKQRGIRPNESRLSTWINNRRRDKKRNMLSVELEANILTLHWWSWNPFADANRAAIEQLKIFYETYHEIPGRRGNRYNEMMLANWIHSRRNDKKNGRLSVELETAIITLPWWSWDSFIDAHKKAIEDLKKFYETHKRAPISKGKQPNEKMLATWISKQRFEKKKGILSAELEATILTLPWWTWDPFTDAHKRSIEDLKIFYETYHDVPINRGKRHNESRLAAWINSRRTEKRKGRLSVELEAVILTLPWWSWDPIKDSYQTVIEQLKGFYGMYKKAPTQRGKNPNETTLAFWMQNRRNEKRKGTLSAELETSILTLPWWSWGKVT